jgi:bacterial/archaeal transporter family-2 protein
MPVPVMVGVIVAFLVGIAGAAQSTLVSRLGGLVGDFRAGIFTNTMSGITAGIIFLIWITRRGLSFWKMTPTVLGLSILTGILGVMIITGISFSLQRTGIAAGFGLVIFGQLLLSALIDSFGIMGAEQIELSMPRLIGLILTAAGAYLLLPRA